MPVFGRRKTSTAAPTPAAAFAPVRDDPHVFSEAILQKVRHIALKARGPVESLFGGEYRSIFKGRGIEFSEVREYQPGDDVRTIDWNVTARRGYPYIKQYVEERQLEVILVVDLSASTAFGTGVQPAADIAAEIAAILALSATGSNDRVGLLLVTDRIELFVPPGTGRRHAMRLVLELLSFRPVGRRTDFTAAIRFIAQAFRHRAIVFLISDFIFEEPADRTFRDEIQGLAVRHDVIPVRLRDPRGDAFPDLGLVSLFDPERGKRMVVDTSDPVVRDGFTRAVGEEERGRSAYFTRLGLDSIEIDTTREYVGPLLEFFRRRERSRA